jgi:hypothetical protein
VKSAACLLALVLVSGAVSGAESHNLYEWLAVAEVVVVGENLGTHGKYAEFRIDRILRGPDVAMDRVRVNVRRANRDRNREVVREPLKFEKGAAYVLLLERVATRKAAAPPTFEFVRGARGAREVPAEGAPAYLEAVERFIGLQDRNDDRRTWRALQDMLEGTNPVLLQTALDLHLKFRRGENELLGSVRPLLDHPSDSMRERATLLVEQILGRNEGEALPEASALRTELIAMARRDPAVAVRVAATRALAALPGGDAGPILEEIADEDPDQEVRYEAERLLLERERQAEEAPGRDVADDRGRSGPAEPRD